MSALKKKPPAMSTIGRHPSTQFLRVTASVSKTAQIEPPPLWPSPIPAIAALIRLFGLKATFAAFR